MKIIVQIALLAGLTACNMKEATDLAGEKFSDQYFKTAISLIELHKIRFGQYPPSLDSLRFLGDWDQGMFTAVVYQKLDSGYVLHVKPIMPDQTLNLHYPAEFWQGLGLVRSNAKK